MSKLALPMILFLACSSSPPQYTKHMNASAGGAITIQLDGDMSASAMRAALLTEAARETIDRSNLYLRVEELTTDTSVDVKQQTNVSTAPAPTPSPNDPYRPPQTAGVSLSRHRSGVIRFTASREQPASGEVYDASQLLDQVRAGLTK